MANYINKVVRIGKVARMVIATFNQETIPFAFDTVNGKPARLDKKKKNKPIAPEADWKQIINQVFAILANEKIITSENVLKDLEAYENGRKKQIRSVKSFSKIIEFKWLMILKSAGIFHLTDGFIKIFRWENGKKIPQIIKGINSAIGMQDYVVEKYEIDVQASETKKLQSIEETLEFIKLNLANWEKLNKAGREKTKREIIWATLQLEKSRNVHKKTAKEKLKTSAEIKDAKNRINPGATAAKNLSAISSVIKRLEQIDAIEIIINLRKEMLILEKKRQIENLERVKAILHGLFRNKIFSVGKIEPYEIAPVCKKITQAVGRLNTIWSFPYGWQAEKTKEFLLKAEEAIKKSDAEMGYISLRNAMTVLLTNLEGYG